MPLEDMGSQACPIHMPQYEKNIHNYVLMSDDQIEFDDVEEAGFALVYRFNWNDQMFAKFYKGKIGRGALYPQHAGDYRVYINGIQISRATIFLEKLQTSCGPYLYMGNPSFVFSELKFYDVCFKPKQFQQIYEEEAVYCDEELQAHLLAVHTGNALRSENWIPDKTWKKKVFMA